MKKIVSVVTVCKNDESGLSRTISSLISQNISNWESIIVIGDSTDGSLEVANDLSKIDTRIRVIQQSTTGIYQGMNEGLQVADGETVWFMNSGDIFPDSQTLSLGAQALNSSETLCIIGGYQYLQGSNLFKYSKKLRKLSPLNFSLNVRGGCHQAMAFDTKSLKIMEGFDLKYNLASDFHLVLRLFNLGDIYRIPDVLAQIELGGVSQKQISNVLKEKQQIRRELFPTNSIIIWSGNIWTLTVRTKIFFRKLGLIK